MDNIQSSSLKTKDQVISDLKELLELVNDGKKGYHKASETTDTPELKALFSKLSGEPSSTNNPAINNSLAMVNFLPSGAGRCVVK